MSGFKVAPMRIAIKGVSQKGTSNAELVDLGAPAAYDIVPDTVMAEVFGTVCGL